MSETTSEKSTADQSMNRDNPDTVARISRTLDEWRARIDELIVHAELASLDIREEVRKRIDVTENVYLAARSRLSDAHRDAESSVISLHQGLDQLLQDLRQAYESAEAVVRRSREP
jgi:hypothetical protein